ncbi:ArsR/SmtB family transcription factor [Longispora albida]|uniref:ArsR/SmtB family transcription factor n=1 Tax=Longispora albida TaxID=203523 RepID=UPI00036A7D5A|nr:metalloregulator ArsR/SmtB family transcription factor [Longispora albida]
MVISAAPDLLRLLADPTRAQIIEILAAGPACTCHLVEDLGTTQPNVSNHLRALRQAGLVKAEPHGRFTYYRLIPEPFDAAAGTLSDLGERARQSAGNRREC